MGSIGGAAAQEDRLVLLRAMRDRICLELDTSSCTRDVEPLMRRLQSVAAEIDELAGQRETDSESVLEQILLRREARKARGDVSAVPIRSSAKAR